MTHSPEDAAPAGEPEEEARFIRCPVCGAKTKTRVYRDTLLIHFPLYCQKCKRETQIDVVNWKLVLSKR